MTAEPAIALTGIRHSYDGRTEILRGVDLRIQPGELCAVMGRSGSGKSTLLNVIGLLDRPTSGSYDLFGVPMGSQDDVAVCTARARVFGFVFRSFHLLDERTVAENVALGALYLGGPPVRAPPPGGPGP